MKEVILPATSFYHVLLSQNIYQPYSCQPGLNLVLSLQEYANFVDLACGPYASTLALMHDKPMYMKYLGEYYRGNYKGLQVLFTMDCIECCIYELRRALQRNEEATLITLEYADAEYLQYDSTVSYINGIQAQLGSRFDKVRESVLQRFARHGVVISGSNGISPHNANYYVYIFALLTTLFSNQYVQSGLKPINVNSPRGEN